MGQIEDQDLNSTQAGFQKSGPLPPARSWDEECDIGSCRHWMHSTSCINHSTIIPVVVCISGPAFQALSERVRKGFNACRSVFIVRGSGRACSSAGVKKTSAGVKISEIFVKAKFDFDKVCVYAKYYLLISFNFLLVLGIYIIYIIIYFKYILSIYIIK